MDRLTYTGHATTKLRLDGANLVTDPYLGRWLGPLRRQGPQPPPDLLEDADVVLVSHLHLDHLDLRSIRRIPAGATLLVPRGASKWLRRLGRVEVREIGRGESLDVAGVQVTGVRADHDGHRHHRGGDEIEPLGFLLEGGGRRTYFAGDTDLFAEMEAIGPVDVAILPVWGWGPTLGTGHLDPEGAAQALALLRARLAVPIHWGTFYPAGLRLLRPGPLSEPPLEFARHARELAPDAEVRVLRPGEGTDL
jgi:L-ascorbate metabolism protein UlaG (beta-lactamase superfamily)